MDVIYNGTFRTPFTMMVVGQSGSGKTSFVTELMKNVNTHVDNPFTGITVFLGTERSNNYLASFLTSQYSSISRIVEVKNNFDDFAKEFPIFLSSIINDLGGNSNHCFIFDDLMTELSECSVLVDLFTKISAHNNISVILITQNMFYKGSGKRASDHVTCYRNTRYLVLMQSSLDNSCTNNVALRIAPKTKGAVLQNMLEEITKTYGYIVIDGDLNKGLKGRDIMFRADIFNQEPIPHQKVFQLGNKPL